VPGFPGVTSGFEAGQREGWHRVLCSDLTPEQRNVAWTATLDTLDVTGEWVL